jgi:negative regulator of sigma E activity
MTDPRPPLSDDDLSAVLDGEAEPDVVARLEADPNARARVASFRAVGDTLRSAPVEPLDAATVDDLVGRALAEAGTVTGDDDGTAAVASPLPPTQRRSAPPWLVAAAVVALVAVGLGLVWSGRGGDDPDLANQANGASSEAAADEASGAGRAPSSRADGTVADQTHDGSTAGADDVETSSTQAGAGPSTATEGLVDLGAFADAAALRRALATAVPPGGQELRADIDAPTDDEVARCDTQVRHVFELADEPTTTAVATLADEVVLVLEYDRLSFADGTTPTTFVTVVDPATCTPDFSFERSPG